MSSLFDLGDARGGGHIEKNVAAYISEEIDEVEEDPEHLRAVILSKGGKIE